MSRRLKSDPASDITLPITPMLDMTFQLLFFFIMTFKPPSKTEGLDRLDLAEQREERKEDQKDGTDEKKNLKKPEHQAEKPENVDPKKESIPVEKIEWEKIYYLTLKHDYLLVGDGKESRNVDISKVSFKIREYNPKDGNLRPLAQDGDRRKLEIPIEDRRLLPKVLYNPVDKSIRPVPLDEEGRKKEIPVDQVLQDQEETSKTKADLKKAIEDTFKEREKVIEAAVAARGDAKDEKALKEAKDREVAAKLIIRIDAERTVPWGDIVAMQDLCQQAGVPRERILFVPPPHWPKPKAPDKPPEKKP
jgi:biopolymer transport protein ExbD